MNELKICFVCTGNTCRSIMAERVFRDILKKNKISGVSVSSKGLDAKGENITENAKTVLREKGYNSRDRKSVKFKKIEKQTLYVVMTDKMLSKIDGKVISMKDLSGQDVIDPFGQSVEIYRQTLLQIEKGCNKLMEKILKIRSER